jgi:hypothetical protein
VAFLFDLCAKRRRAGACAMSDEQEPRMSELRALLYAALLDRIEVKK